MITKTNVNRQYVRKMHRSDEGSNVFGIGDRQTLRRAGLQGNWWRGLDGVWRDENGRTVTITQKLHSGNFFNLLEPNPANFTDEDLALGLSREMRWSGQTAGDFGYSVAQHSVFVVQILEQKYPRITTAELLYALLHDAEEGLGVKDTITGLKHVIGERYIEIGLSIREAVHHKFHLPWPAQNTIESKIKKADDISGATEAVELMGFTIEEYTTRIGKTIEPISDPLTIEEYVTPWHPQKARDSYLEKLRRLASAVNKS